MPRIPDFVLFVQLELAHTGLDLLNEASNL
jgi:hypothetical protein